MNNSEIPKIALVFLLVGLTCGLILGFRAGKTKRSHDEGKVVVDTIMHIDTLTYRATVVKDSTVLRYETRVLPVSAKKPDSDPQSDNGVNVPPPMLAVESDSVAVEIPITQKRFEGEAYTAWVSGYEPNLDSIKILQPITTITLREKPPDKRWGVGVQVGYGVTPNGKLAPFVGIGLTYNIWRF